MTARPNLPALRNRHLSPKPSCPPRAKSRLPPPGRASTSPHPFRPRPPPPGKRLILKTRKPSKARRKFTSKPRHSFPPNQFNPLRRQVARLGPLQSRPPRPLLRAPKLKDGKNRRTLL